MLALACMVCTAPAGAFDRNDFAASARKNQSTLPKQIGPGLTWVSIIYNQKSNILNYYFTTDLTQQELRNGEALLRKIDAEAACPNKSLRELLEVGGRINAIYTSNKDKGYFISTITKSDCS
jgi:hypothetical protein